MTQRALASADAACSSPIASPDDWAPAFDCRQPRRISTLSMVACSSAAARARPDAKAKSAAPRSDVSVARKLRAPVGAVHIVRCRIAGQEALRAERLRVSPRSLEHGQTNIDSPERCQIAIPRCELASKQWGLPANCSWVGGQVDGASAAIADSLRDRHLRGPNQTSDLSIDSPPWQGRSSVRTRQ